MLNWKVRGENKVKQSEEALKTCNYCKCIVQLPDYALVTHEYMSAPQRLNANLIKGLQEYCCSLNRWEESYVT